MPYRLDDTIAAIASPPAGGARGILRLSGPGTVACLGQVFRPEGQAAWSESSHPAVFAGVIRLRGERATLPCHLFLWPTAKSYTGQPAAEIHTFGSPPLLEAALEALFQAGARLAEPGEFTCRAFLNGRLDLTQAEAVLGVVDAANPRQFRVAVAQLAGGLARPLKELRDALADLLAQLEASFDFVDEDIQFLTPESLQQELAQAARTVAQLAAQMASRAESTERPRIVLAGWPNTGKSSLFNALLGKTGALVSHQAGTTRDYLTAEIDLDGLPATLVDTAGFQIGEPGGIGRAAQEAAARQAEAARVQLFCIDSTRPLYPWERSQLARGSPGRRLVLTKCDAPRNTDFPGRAVMTSSVTGEGIDRLRARLRDGVLAARIADGDVVAGTAVRCRHALRRAAGCLTRARRLAHRGDGDELVAAEIHTALNALGQIVGAVATEELLDRIFSRFCVGK